jgi:hypothetical protein
LRRLWAIMTHRSIDCRERCCLRDDICNNCTCECNISQSVSDRAHIMTIDRYWVENNKTSDDQVSSYYWRVIAINWNFG